MAIAAIALCVNLTACSSDDDGGNNENGGNSTQTTTDSFGVIKGQKKLIKLTANYNYDDEYSVTYTLTFSYDKNGRLAEVVKRYEGTSIYINTYSYVWNEKEMSVTCYCTSDDGYYDYSLQFKGYIKNGMFYGGTGYAGDYAPHHSTATYKSGKLTEFKSQYTNIDGSIGSSERTFVWNDDKLMSVGPSSGSYYDYIYTYDDRTCKGYNPYIVYTFVGAEMYTFDIDDFSLICAHPELLGLRTNYLPKTLKIYGDGATFTYTLDDNGYLRIVQETCKHEGEYETKTSTNTFTFTWE